MGVVGKCVSKENPKSDLDLGLRVWQLQIMIAHSNNNFRKSVSNIYDEREIFSKRNTLSNSKSNNIRETQDFETSW